MEHLGKPLTVRGINLGSWLNIENYMIGLSGSDWQIREAARQIWGEEKTAAYFKEYLDLYITEADIQHIADLGFNTVRLPVDYRLLESDAAPGVYNGPAWSRIEDCLDWCETAGLALMLDLHGAPGGQNTTPPSGNRSGYNQLWSDRHFQYRTVSLWEELVRRFKAKPAMWSYNLFNEPMVNNHGPQTEEEQTAAMNELCRRLIETIRKQDPDTYITIECPTRSSGGVHNLDENLFADQRTIFSYHHYPLAAHESSANFEKDQADANSPEVLAEFLHGQLADEKAYADRIGRPVILGEFGLSAGWDPERGEAMVAAQLKVNEDYGWGWMLWCYKDLWNLGLLRPKSSCNWVKWARDPERLAQTRKVDELFHHWFDEVIIENYDKTPENYRCYDAAFDDMKRGIQRVQLDSQMRELAEKPLAEIKDFARDFSLTRCERREELWALLAPWL